MLMFSMDSSFETRSILMSLPALNTDSDTTSPPLTFVPTDSCFAFISRSLSLLNIHSSVLRSSTSLSRVFFSASVSSPRAISMPSSSLKPSTMSFFTSSLLVSSPVCALMLVIQSLMDSASLSLNFSLGALMILLMRLVGASMSRSPASTFAFSIPMAPLPLIFLPSTRMSLGCLILASRPSFFNA